ncbi:MAG: hypothetical protein H0V27_06310 [Pyrinomonadaceae bacterium]|nr:hypothetical protein [Pyrinomonadaceae bacterium]
MMGHHFGTPFHVELQRRVITEALTHLVEAERSGEVRRVSVTWAEARRQGIELERKLGLRN